jgi:catechol 2,3-dioxygenase-like lactoylglutathione lyase family enzyme
MDGLAPYFFQVAYVVRDLDAAESWFRRTMGVRHFTRMDRVELEAGCRHRGRPSDAALALSLGWLGDTQLELVCPLEGESIHAEFLAAGRTGLHHVAYAVPDFAVAAAGMAAQGLVPVADGVLETGMRVEFAYYDCTGDGASFIELLGFDAAARTFMAGLKAAASREIP